jgi:hypothetical protein
MAQIHRFPLRPLAIDIHQNDFSKQLCCQKRAGARRADIACADNADLIHTKHTPFAPVCAQKSVLCVQTAKPGFSTSSMCVILSNGSLKLLFDSILSALNCGCLGRNTLKKRIPTRQIVLSAVFGILLFAALMFLCGAGGSISQRVVIFAILLLATGLLI